MGLFSFIFKTETENGLNKKRDAIYREINKVGGYKRALVRELDDLEKIQQRLRLDLNEVNIKLKKFEK